MIWTAFLTLALAGQTYDIKVPVMGSVSACEAFIDEVYDTAPRILEIRDAACIEEKE